MRRGKGFAISPGLATGRAFVYLHHTVEPERCAIGKEDAPREVERFRNALSAAKTLISREAEQGRGGEDILSTHLMMLDDPEFTSAVEKSIKTELVCAPWAVENEAAKVIAFLEGAGDAHVKERAEDIRDISQQLIKILQGIEASTLASITEDCIIVGDILLPSEMFAMNRAHVLGIALDGEGRTSHTAILARTFQIPAVLGLGDFSSHVLSGNTVMVDGTEGEAIVSPTPEVRDEVEERHREEQKREAHLEDLRNLPTETKEGRKIRLLCNVEMSEEIPSVKDVRADGIGLFRSEYLLINDGAGVSEETQYREYSRIVKGMAPLPVTIRTFDVGGDKVVPGLGIDEQNPILGWRAVRFCLSRKDIFTTQLRALLRASADGKLRIMFPMVSGAAELDAVLSLLGEVKAQLDADHVPYDHDIEIGTMIEVPSAALCAEFLAKRVDFFSIGTNDLTQYTLAVDRGNEKISYLYQPFHPAVLRLIHMTIVAAHAAGIPVGMCGEMAGDVSAAALLIGLGLDELSMDPSSVLPVREVIRSITMEEARSLAQQTLSLEKEDDVASLMAKWMHEHVPAATVHMWNKTEESARMCPTK